MENNSFKTVAFGGFDKQDVVRYIEQSAREHMEEVQQITEQKSALEQERDGLQASLEELRLRLPALESQCQAQAKELNQLRAEQEQTAKYALELEQAYAQIQSLTAELESAQSDADSYRQFRNQIGDIECQARRRAAELENQTQMKLRQMLADFHARYQELLTLFDGAAARANSELRKVTLNLTQLPRILDQVGTEVTRLEQSLDPSSKPEPPKKAEAPAKAEPPKQLP